MSDSLRVIARRWHLNLWTLIVSPIVWAAHFLLCYIVVAVHCAKRGRLESLGDVRIVIAAGTLAALAVVAMSAYIAWAHWTIEGDAPPYRDSTEEDRERFLGVAKLLLAGLSFVAIVFTAIPAFLIGDCR